MANWKKKYEDLIERLRKAKEDNSVNDERYCCAIDEIVPELKEPEDERMFKALIEGLYDAVNGNGWDLFGGIDIRELIAWLEKQGDKKPIDDLTPQEAMDIAVAKFFEQGEQNPANKVESKFKVGYWLAENEPNNYARFIQILEVVDVQGKERYRISRDLHNDEDIVECRFVENNYHPFNIKDAKAGDVLATLDYILIFKEHLSKDGGVSYCHYDFTSFKPQFIWCEDRNWYFGKEAIVHPATKEQCDKLEKAMADAGYTFDFEKKELKKIEQKPVDNVESKLKIEKGKWYICIRNLDDDYGTRAFYNGDTYYSPWAGALIPSNSNIPSEIKYCVEDYFRLWTIQDAKAGDVLNSMRVQATIIFKGLVADGKHILAYCALQKGIFIKQEMLWDRDFEPCPENWNDELFQKMHEAGYMWDSENKQLLSLKAEPKDEYNSEWSEDDDITMGYLCTFIEENGDTFYGENKPNVISWLRALKYREREKGFDKGYKSGFSASEFNHWKPSEEQIKALEFFIPYVTKCSVVLQKSKDTLLSLLSDLKKLREE